MGTHHRAKTPTKRRQQTVEPTSIAKRHKTVRAFLTNFEKIFFMLA